MTEIIRINPDPAWLHLDIIIEEQAIYYGRQSQHVLDYLRNESRVERANPQRN